MRVPDWYAVVLLGLATFRVWRLFAEDDVLDVPRRRLLGAAGWKPGDPTPEGYRTKWAEFLTCPWCAGFWIGCVWYGFWQWQPKWALVAAALFVVNTIAALTSENLDPPEG